MAFGGWKKKKKEGRAPMRGIEPRPRRWERRILTTRPHGIAYCSLQMTCTKWVVASLNLSLRFLPNCSNNRITTDGALVLAKALPTNESLTVFKVYTLSLPPPHTLTLFQAPTVGSYSPLYWCCLPLWKELFTCMHNLVTYDSQLYCSCLLSDMRYWV